MKFKISYSSLMKYINIKKRNKLLKILNNQLGGSNPFMIDYDSDEEETKEDKRTKKNDNSSSGFNPFMTDYDSDEETKEDKRTKKIDDSTNESNEEKKQELIQELTKHLMCPITRTLMIDPVIASDGFTYERESIENWLRSNRTSPNTREFMRNNLIPNLALKNLIEFTIDEGILDLEATKEYLDGNYKRLFNIIKKKINNKNINLFEIPDEYKEPFIKSITLDYEYENNKTTKNILIKLFNGKNLLMSQNEFYNKKSNPYSTKFSSSSSSSTSNNQVQQSSSSSITSNNQLSLIQQRNMRYNNPLRSRGFTNNQLSSLQQQYMRYNPLSSRKRIIEFINNIRSNGLTSIKELYIGIFGDSDYIKINISPPSNLNSGTYETLLMNSNNDIINEYGYNNNIKRFDTIEEVIEEIKYLHNNIISSNQPIVGGTSSTFTSSSSSSKDISINKKKLSLEEFTIIEADEEYVKTLDNKGFHINFDNDNKFLVELNILLNLNKDDIESIKNILLDQLFSKNFNELIKEELIGKINILREINYSPIYINEQEIYYAFLNYEDCMIMEKIKNKLLNINLEGLTEIVLNNIFYTTNENFNNILETGNLLSTKYIIDKIDIINSNYTCYGIMMENVSYEGMEIGTSKESWGTIIDEGIHKYQKVPIWNLSTERIALKSNEYVKYEVLNPYIIVFTGESVEERLNLISEYFKNDNIFYAENISSKNFLKEYCKTNKSVIVLGDNTDLDINFIKTRIKNKGVYECRLVNLSKYFKGDLNDDNLLLSKKKKFKY